MKVRSSGPGTATALMVLALTLPPLPAQSQESPPTVEVEFLVESGSQFDENLSAAEKAGLRERVDDLLLSLFESHFSFLEWVKAGEATEPVARLTLSLGDVERAGGMENRLRFSGTIEGSEADMSELPGIKVYEWWELDKHDAVRLGDRIVSELEQRIEPLEEPIHTTFLRAVPIARKVFADAEEQRIFIPVDWDRLRAAHRSILFVEFSVAGEGDEARSGVLRVSAVKRRTKAPIPGCVEGLVLFYDLGDARVTEEGDWHPEIAAHLEAGSGMRVLMEEYFKNHDPNTSGGLVTELD